MFGSKKTSPGAEHAPQAVAPKPADALTNGKAALVEKPAVTAMAAPALGEVKETEETKKQAAAAQRFSTALTQIIGLLIRSPQHKHLALTDLEWLLFPPLTAGQFAIANVQTKEGGAGVPAAVALWACVSPDVDQKLSENLTAPMRLRPDEWKSGNIFWLVEAVGDGRIVPEFLKQLQESTFKGKEVKTRSRGPDGKPAIRALSDVLQMASTLTELRRPHEPPLA